MEDHLVQIVSSLMDSAVRDVLLDESYSATFQTLHDQLETIAEQNRQILNNIPLDDLNVNYGDHEQSIRDQYAAFLNMVTQVMRHPADASRHKDDFNKIYEEAGGVTSLDVFYRGVTGEGLFGPPILQVYLDHCDRNRNIMRHRCSHLRSLFDMGLAAFRAYTVVTEDDVEEAEGTWTDNMRKVQTKMDEVLRQCND